MNIFRNRHPDMRFVSRSFAALLAVLFLAACSAQLKPPAPKLPPPPPDPAPLASVLSVPFRVAMPGLAQRLNDGIVKEMYRASDIDLGNDNRLKIVVERAPILLRTVDGGLVLSTSLHVALAVDGKVLGVTHHEDGKLDAQVTLGAVLAITEDYRLVSQTTGDFRIDRAEIALGPVRVNVKDQVADRIRPSFQALIREIDKQIAGAVDLRGVLGRTWTELAQPIRIASHPEAWLLIQPRTLRVATPRSEGDDLVFGFSVECLTGVWLLRKPDPAQTGGLPKVIIGGAPQSTLRLAFPIAIGYQEASQMATAALAKKPFALKAGVQLHVKRATVSGSGSTFVLRIDYTANAGRLGGSEGFLFFTGRPVYDEARREMRVEQFDYDLGTRDVVSRVADWLLHKDFVEAVRRELVFPFGGKQDAQHADAERAGQEVKLGNVATVRFSLGKLAPAATLEITPTDLRAYVVAEGSLEVRVGTP